MSKDYKAIATKYRNFEFRSRLEAKYAVFFDLVGWRWSYEPPERAGWIPDFAIGERPTLVEVKPFYRTAEWGDAVQKIIDSGERENVILLGSDPCWISAEPDNESGSDEPRVAWLLTEGQVWDLHFGFCGNDKLGLCPMQHAWRNQIWIPPTDCRKPNKWSTVGISRSDKEKYLVEYWGEACNISKWIPKAAIV